MSCRNPWLWLILFGLVSGFGPSAKRPDSPLNDPGPARKQESKKMPGEPADKGVQRPRTDAQWREALTSEQYYVTRQKGTEAPFTGAYWDCKTPGVYRCVCCDAVLFDSGAKFDAGCGWPSFSKAMLGDNVVESVDRSHGMERTEVTCKQCGAHLGHLFDDGPRPSGLRYCINSASLRLEPKK
jgi:peptide-methionine (R)-S-oxide reductase